MGSMFKRVIHPVLLLGLVLACTGITLRHPRTNMPIIFESPPEPAFAAVMTALGWIGALERYEKKSI